MCAASTNGKIDAELFSLAGDKYLGRKYTEMDCQAFVERCMADCGLRMDLRGSNAWWRKMTWKGTPEECKRIFGRIPKGALLFIWKDDGGETARGYTDGEGNASHIGIKTGRGDGAIHSSQSKGCVVSSVFRDRTISGGGWNRVGLFDRFSYGADIDGRLEAVTGGAATSQGSEETQMSTARTAQTWAQTGGTVNMRTRAEKSAALVKQIPIGDTVIILEERTEWTRCQWGSKKGWIQNQFLVTAEDGPEDFSAEDAAAEADGNDFVTFTVTMRRDEAKRIFADADVDAAKKG